MAHTTVLSAAEACLGSFDRFLLRQEEACISDTDLLPRPIMTLQKARFASWIARADVFGPAARRLDFQLRDQVSVREPIIKYIQDLHNYLYIKRSIPPKSYPHGALTAFTKECLTSYRLIRAGEPSPSPRGRLQGPLTVSRQSVKDHPRSHRVRVFI